MTLNLEKSGHPQKDDPTWREEKRSSSRRMTLLGEKKSGHPQKDDPTGARNEICAMKKYFGSCIFLLRAGTIPVCCESELSSDVARLSFAKEDESKN